MKDVTRAGLIGLLFLVLAIAAVPVMKEVVSNWAFVASAEALAASDYEGAEKYADFAFTLNPTKITWDALTTSHMNVARELYITGDFEATLEYVEGALIEYPTDYGMMIVLVDLRLNWIIDYQVALDYLQSIAKSHPSEGQRRWAQKVLDTRFRDYPDA